MNLKQKQLVILLASLGWLYILIELRIWENTRPPFYVEIQLLATSVFFSLTLASLVFLPEKYSEKVNEKIVETVKWVRGLLGR